MASERDFAPLFTWRSAVVDSALKPTTRHVLLTLSLHMNERGGSCFPSVDRLVRETGLGRSTVIRALQSARDNGWLHVQQSSGRFSNRYSAVVPPEDQPSRKTTVPEWDGSDPGPSHDWTVPDTAANRVTDDDQPCHPSAPTVPERDPSTSMSSSLSSSVGHQAFEAFWSAYPRRIGKGNAERAFHKAAKKNGAPVILDALQGWCSYWERNGTEMQFIPHPATWLNRCGWLDEIPPDEKPANRAERNTVAAVNVAALLTGNNLLGIGAGA